MRPAPLLLAATLLAGLPFAGDSGAQPPILTLTQTPACGAGPIGGAADLNVTGTAAPVTDATDYHVAAYVFTTSWWTKPSLAVRSAPLVPGAPGTGTFSIDVTTHVNDLDAGYFALFLLPDTMTPPPAEGLRALPAELFEHPWAAFSRECAHRVFPWRGRLWHVKDSGGALWGPGPNVWSDAPGNVRVDGDDRLHLRIDRQQGRWRCAEVTDITADPAVSTPGFGTYRFQVAGRLDQLDANIVLGLFTWDDDPASAALAHREIDFEAARWGNAADPTNAQYVVQPWDATDHLLRFTIPAGDTPTTHEFTWLPDRVDFRSWVGVSTEPQTPGDLIASYSYEGPDVPPAGGTEHVHLNLWLVSGDAPTNGQPAEVVLQDVAFLAVGPSGVGDGEPGGGAGGADHRGSGGAPRVDWRVAPNPARTGAVLHFGGSLAADYDLRVVDAQGRLVADLGRAAAGASSIAWDGRRADGGAAATGRYYFVGRGARDVVVRSVVLVR
jgi:hypothetical protein